jgi:hypothetical protein
VSGAPAHYLACNCAWTPPRAILIANLLQKGATIMTPHRILQLNALSTAACAVGMLATRGTLHSLFGLSTPTLLDGLAVGLLAYAGALVFAAQRPPVGRRTLIAFTIADAAWVAASAVVLWLFWAELAPLARLLVIAAAIAVEGFATLQFRAEGTGNARSPRLA